MSLLDRLPHRCRIERVIRQKDSMGGSKEIPVVEQDDIPCWVQQASSSEMTLFAKRGMNSMRKIFFATDPQINERHQIVVTKFPNETTDFEGNPLTVLSTPRDDVSAGLGLLWRVMVGEQSPEFA
jgi:hypothetical protein